MSKSYDAYMKLDKSVYAGEFVGMCEGEVVAHSTSLEEVYHATKKACGATKVPFIAQVLTADCMLL